MPTPRQPLSAPGPGRLRAWLELSRPANVATALADVLAGASVAGAGFVAGRLGWLLAATTCLYAGGIVLNDFFDREVDARERPERPIPGGRVPAWQAACAGGGLLVLGAGAGLAAGPVSGLVAAAVALAVLAYDGLSKRDAFLGPINMGVCRSLNLLLGMTAVPTTLTWAWPLGLLPLTYIAAVTMVSRGEVHGSKRPVLQMGLGLIGAVVVALGVIAATGGMPAASVAPGPAARVWGVLLAAVLGWRVIPLFRRASITTAPGDIRAAVRNGVLSLVLVDAVIAASYAGIMNSLAVLAAGLLAWWLARLFAVT